MKLVKYDRKRTWAGIQRMHSSSAYRPRKLVKNNCRSGLRRRAPGQAIIGPARAWSAAAAAGGTGGGDEAQGGHISTEARINERIRSPEVRLVGPKGEQIGIVSVNDALKLAQEADLDLVEVAPTARPPVLLAKPACP